MERNDFSNFGGGSPKEHLCEIILKSVHWSRRRHHFKGFSICRSGGHFIQQSRTILAILVKGHPRNISVKIFLKSVHWSRRCHLMVFLFLALAATLFSGAEPF